MKPALICVFIWGFILRVLDITRPFWMDEVLYMRMLDRFRWQEFTTVGIGKLFGISSEIGARLPIVIAGSLTILAVYWVIHDKRYALACAVFVAICPLFTFWSGMARPYAFAGLFMVLGFRLWWCYPVALLTTPISIVGLNVFKLKYWPMYLLLIIGAIVLFKIRPDSGRDFLKWEFLANAKRIWYLPVLSLVVHLGILFSGKPQGLCKDNIGLARGSASRLLY